MVAAFGTVSNSAIENIPRQDVVEQLALRPLTVAPDADQTFLREDRVQRGDTVMELLQRLGIDDPAAVGFLKGSATTQSLFRQLSPGKNLSARTGPQGELHTLVFPLNGGKDQALVVERQGDRFVASEQTLPLETQVVMKTAEIRYSLFGASDAAGIPDSVATQLADIFGGDIDFHRDLRKGDRFAVIYESVNHLGRAVRSGRILAAEFVNNGKTYRAAWFADASDGENTGGYYTAEGKNIRKAFLRSPLEFSRITSGFTSARFHPVLQKWRAHRGVDYGAPVGTRVKATGNGVVEFVGVQGGYGKVVILRHQGRYTTLYGHLSGFASGLRKGSRVSQGDVIAFVGATGLASGPHLHYEFRVGDMHQNPLAIALPSAPPLMPQQLAQFQAQTGIHLARLDLIRGFNLAQSN
ncbi:peptidoglycan DD-metalloendopeptidase family protein [Sulfuritalea sp.]|uniref:M23 family metallopeptidase n=1 Tax=Sulfuritalea sp. TaxID=2480090 RepID=UPI001AC2065B|nr:peptidoglycan DD-metalloendopeptidase family protein [Sulfuritalea sp.]MBN8477209.1 peptidoglycan DD-metalloendopeptidase family protein [Sulfuritalea sp.]